MSFKIRESYYRASSSVNERGNVRRKPRRNLHNFGG
jgi:hypothetical protein